MRFLLSAGSVHGIVVRPMAYFGGPYGDPATTILGDSGQVEAK